MGTYFSKYYSVPGSATSELEENTFNKYMRATSNAVNNQALSVSIPHAYDHKCARTNEKNTPISKMNNFVNENCMLPQVQIERLQYSPTKFDALADKTVKQGNKPDDYSNKIVDVTKLLAQLMNAKVVLRKLEEPLTKYSDSRGIQTNVDLDYKKDGADGTDWNDYATRYCAGCKKTKYARIKDPTVKNCSDCKIAMTYLCTKCNEKHYRRYPFLLLHLDRCGGSSVVDDKLTDGTDVTETSKKSKSAGDTKSILDRSSFIVKEFQSVNMTKKWSRYCSRCEVVTASYDARICSCGESLFFTCKKCHRICNRYVTLKYHLQNQCFPTAQYQCTHCKYSTTCWQKMQKHFKFMHTNLPLIKCKFCSYETKRRSNLDTHLKIKHDHIDNKFYCSSCSYSTKFERNFRRHKRLHH